ncbi:hypothetical protein GCM10023091_06410 [Ravibacter arvi]|uniref:Xylose isomerase-like TIM barrel domain-containing protein n=1 Tax=Ravibacter arvi TaxID=2051041 RepID=A0ABP8LPC1_9BACT
MTTTILSRRDFLKKAGAATAVGVSGVSWPGFSRKHPVGAHLWVYASAYPPDWDCTPRLEEIFDDMRYAGIEGLEVMDVLLRRNGNPQTLRELSQKYKVRILGTSYSADIWNQALRTRILDDVALVTERLQECGGKTFGISVGTPRRKKTVEELDAQALTLKEIYAICSRHGIVANLHNHTYEVENDLYDLKGTLARLPESKLGPDLAWLVRAGVDPVEFIRKYHRNMVYLHLRDQDQSANWTEAMGEGNINFDAIARVLKEVNYSGPATIELAFPKGFTPTRPLRESWKISRGLVREKFGW